MLVLLYGLDIFNKNYYFLLNFTSLYVEYYIRDLGLFNNVNTTL